MYKLFIFQAKITIQGHKVISQKDTPETKISVNNFFFLQRSDSNFSSSIQKHSENQSFCFLTIIELVGIPQNGRKVTDSYGIHHAHDTSAVLFFLEL